MNIQQMFALKKKKSLSAHAYVADNIFMLHSSLYQT